MKIKTYKLRTALIITLANLLISSSIFAQSPQKMSYQAVIRNSSDALVTNTQIGMQISILQGSTSGTAVYVETQTPTTNTNGLLSIEIGAGTVVSGDFATIDWANGPYFIETKTDITGGATYTITGTSQLLSVPYALHANTAETISGGITETDPTFTSSQAANITATDITNLSNLSGVNTGDQDLSNLATKTALGDSTAIVRSEIPDVSGFLTSETDPLWSASPSFGISNSNISNWNSVYGWGNHADEGYLTSFTEVDPKIGANTSGYSPKWNGSAMETGAIYQDASNNVGIGTTTPAYKLDVSEDAQINGVRVGRGNGNVSTNTAAGTDALTSNTWGQYNSAYGYQSLYFNTSGERNTAIGFNALFKNSTGNANTAIGQSALQENTNGSENTATGRQSLQYNLGGSENAAYGFWALNSNTTGIKNTCLGNYSGALNVTGSSNVFIGYRSGQDETGSNKLYIANSSTSTPLIYGDFSSSTLTVYSNLNINNNYTFPSVDGSSGQILSTNGAGVLGWNSLAAVATTGSYNDLTDKPVIPVVPTNVSAFTNDVGYLTSESQVLSINHDTIFLTGGSYVKLPDSHPGSTLPTVLTVAVSDITYTGCSADGNVTVSGGELVISRGIVLASHSNPTLSDTVFTSGSGTGIFNVEISQLAPNHTYYIRAFATNILGTVYGSQLSFTTLSLTTPTLTTNAIYNISHTTAMSGGNITDDGGSTLIERGICWSLNTNPTIVDNTDPEGTAVGIFNALMSGLSPATLYYVRAYATNTQGTAYGNELSFTTNTLSLASITTTAPSAVTYTTATSGGNVTADNGSSVTSRGICWATTSNPTTADFNYTEAGGLGSFTADMTGLLPSTIYYVRAFAVNGAGTVYGNEYNFTTAALTAPELTTKAVSGISSNIAASGGTITTDGGSAITAKGVCWSVNTAPSLADNYTTDGTGSASYNSTMTGLNPLTLYYVRAYATNSLGTSYGNEQSFTTTDLAFPGPSVPTVGTSASVMNSTSTASSGGYVSSDGGSAVTARGVCWSSNSNPTLADNFSTDGGTGIGYFSSVITGLSGCGNVFYIRAYATNSTGTGYGNQNTVSTGLLPTVTTDDITGIDYYVAISGGTVTDDGGCAITQKGVCWSYNPNPTIGNPHTSEGAGNGSFVSNITGLYANRTYYVRSYATNSAGTSYGPQQVFTTATPSTPYIGQSYAGGIVFYVDGSGEHGLVCAPSDQGFVAWGCTGTSISGTGTALGTGSANTAAIIAGCVETTYAAKLCDNLVFSGYSDWFQPSMDELILMFINLRSQGLGGFVSDCYWSSSEYNASNAWRVYFGNGGGTGLSGNQKSYYYYVRAVRAF